MVPPGKVVGLVCKKIYHFPSFITCLVTIGIQTYIVNHYLVTHYNSSWYAWYAADALSCLCFIAAFVDSYRHLKHKRNSSVVVKNLFNGKLGYLPLVYLSWLVYSLFLAIRIGIIFRYIAPSLDEALMFGPNMLKTGLSLSSIVFFLLVVAHVEAEPKSIIDNYVTAIIGRVTIDILDSVQFLELLFINESHLFLTFNLHNAIVVIGCSNLILPTFKLMILSGWRFGETRVSKLFETLYIVSDLLIINVPFLVIRLLLWSVHSQDVSVFIIKNVLSLCMTIKAIHDHFVDLSKDDLDAGPPGEIVPMQDLRHPVSESEHGAGDAVKEQLHPEESTHKFV